MKEIRFFYAPNIAETHELPTDEASHALRVLRLNVGDEVYVLDGKGNIIKAIISKISGKHCLLDIQSVAQEPKSWHGYIHLCVAPTKMMERMEWFCEKATEIGVDEISFIESRFSERKVIKTERIEKVVVSAVKQSHKTYMPKINEIENFKNFIKRDFKGQKFIAHCYNQNELCINDEKPFLMDVLNTDDEALVMIGPEGDFSVDEVKEAIKVGFIPISLGNSRLRTETAALVAVHIMNIVKR